jgi:predicted RNA-binding Zn-ribbon protein involved in translation (DUF1610 family)
MNKPIKVICTECGRDIDVRDEHLKSLICPYCGVVIELKRKEEPRKLLSNLSVRKGCKGCH